MGGGQVGLSTPAGSRESQPPRRRFCVFGGSVEGVPECVPGCRIVDKTVGIGGEQSVLAQGAQFAIPLQGRDTVGVVIAGLLTKTGEGPAEIRVPNRDVDCEPSNPVTGWTIANCPLIQPRRGRPPRVIDLRRVVGCPRHTRCGHPAQYCAQAFHAHGAGLVVRCVKRRAR